MKKDAATTCSAAFRFLKKKTATSFHLVSL
jgi:hypothetical protein